MIILDTDTISNLMRPQPSPGLMARLAEVPADQQATTSITVGELAYGADKAHRPELYSRALTLLSGVNILDFDRAAAEHYGQIRAQLERDGEPLADLDLRIAAVARTHQSTLISGNLKHFARVPRLAVQDWISDPA